MSYKKEISQLWNMFEDALTAGYKASLADPNNSALPLRDYVDDGRDMRNLVSEETANERQHRRGAPYIPGVRPAVSSNLAARAILLHQVARGSEAKEMPAATCFLIWRRSAAEAFLLGFLVRAHLTDEFRRRAIALDYASLMGRK